LVLCYLSFLQKQEPDYKFYRVVGTGMTILIDD
jgi:hypothetical protein